MRHRARAAARAGTRQETERMTLIGDVQELRRRTADLERELGIAKAMRALIRDPRR